MANRKMSKQAREERYKLVVALREKKGFTFERIAIEMGLNSSASARSLYKQATKVFGLTSLPEYERLNSWGKTSLFAKDGYFGQEVGLENIYRTDPNDMLNSNKVGKQTLSDLRKILKENGYDVTMWTWWEGYNDDGEFGGTQFAREMRAHFDAQETQKTKLEVLYQMLENFVELLVEKRTVTKKEILENVTNKWKF